MKSSKAKSIILIVVVVAWALFIPPIYSNYNVDFANKYLNRRLEEDQRIMKEFAAQGVKATQLWTYRSIPHLCTKMALRILIKYF